eukprot:9096350-Pyramimonas_sp.AAC.1
MIFSYASRWPQDGSELAPREPEMGPKRLASRNYTVCWGPRRRTHQSLSHAPCVGRQPEHLQGKRFRREGRGC